MKLLIKVKVKLNKFIDEDDRVKEFMNYIKSIRDNDNPQKLSEIISNIKYEK